MRSIREEACKGGSRHYFIQRDITMYLLLLQKSLLREVENFLADHNIGTTDFQAQAKVIIDASYKNYSVPASETSGGLHGRGGRQGQGLRRRRQEFGWLGQRWGPYEFVYEVHINEIHRSNVAIGDDATDGRDPGPAGSGRNEGGPDGAARYRDQASRASRG